MLMIESKARWVDLIVVLKEGLEDEENHESKAIESWWIVDWSIDIDKMVYLYSSWRLLSRNSYVVLVARLIQTAPSPPLRSRKDDLSNPPQRMKPVRLCQTT